MDHHGSANSQLKDEKIFRLIAVKELKSCYTLRIGFDPIHVLVENQSARGSRSLHNRIGNG